MKMVNEILIIFRTCKCKDYSGNPPKLEYDRKLCEQLINEDNQRRRDRGEEVAAGWCLKSSLMIFVVLPIMSWFWSMWFQSK